MPSRRNSWWPQNVNFAVSLEVLADFLDKNKVPFRNTPRAVPIDTARVAEMAQAFTYHVECRGASQQAARNPPRAEVKPKPSPSFVKPPVSEARTFTEMPASALTAMRGSYANISATCRDAIEYAATQCLVGNDCREAFEGRLLPACNPTYTETCFATLYLFRGPCTDNCESVAEAVGRRCSQ
jgi:hypothetical protein